MKILNLALANIKKSITATASLFMFILVAALLLNLGLMVMMQISAFYDSKVKQLQDPHAIIMMDKESYHDKHAQFIADYPGVIESEVEEAILMSNAKFHFASSELTSSALIYNADASRISSNLHWVEQSNSKSVDDIYLPYIFNTNGGYKLHDRFIISYKGESFEYKVAGFFETTMLGTTSIGMMKYILPEAAYQVLLEKLDASSRGMQISAIMEQQTEAPELLKAFNQTFPQLSPGQTEAYRWQIDIEMVKSVSMVTINVIAMILVAFAIVIVLVSLIVIKYRVSNSIEDGMAAIGVLKAIGYSNRQILSSMILQFLIITVCAGVCGVALSYSLMPFIGRIISSLSGLVWLQAFDPIINVINIGVVVICVVLVTLASAIRIRTIHPITALRGGIQTHSFRRNYFPIEHTRGGLHFLLALKSMITYIKQNIMILFIIISLTFASIFSVVLYYNIASDKTAFVNLFGAEPANVMLLVEPEASTRELMSSLNKLDEVKKVSIFDLIDTKIDGEVVYTNVTDDYSELENNIVYEGRQPKYENEIAISWVVANQINKGIGDSVEVEYGTMTASFLVTGLSQSIGNLGQVASLTMDGMQQLQSSYKGTTLYVYLDGMSNGAFMNKVQQQYGSSIIETLDIDENIESQTAMYTSAVFAVMLMILTITIFIVVLILYLVIKTMIIKRKKEFGVMKAIGFSTIQLMHQISISFLPVVLAGVSIGGILAYFYTNTMLSALLSAAGVKRLEFIIHIPFIVLLCIGLLALAYIVSMLVAIKIKSISAYSLITE